MHVYLHSASRLFLCTPALLLTGLASAQTLGSASCDPSWISSFGGLPGTDFPVKALAVFDEGNGPSLFAGGAFATAGSVQASGVARWNGESWSALGSGIAAGCIITTVNALAVFDDGGGPALYAGGEFGQAGGVTAQSIAKWDGTSWSALSPGLTTSCLHEVHALAVFDDGSGPALYVGGDFKLSSGAVADYLARWDGASWSAVGTGVNGVVRALEVHDDGSGPMLYAGGDFTTAGGAPAAYVARWNGSSWSALDGGMNSSVLALASADDGSGSVLYAGGAFTMADTVAASRVARWKGSNWSALGAGTNGNVTSLRAFDDGSATALYAGGSFTTAGGGAARRIAKWNGASWSEPAGGVSEFSPSVDALVVFDDGNGDALYAGGGFNVAGGVGASFIARWSGTAWSGLGTGVSDAVLAFAVYDDGGGPALYAGGEFLSVGGVPASRVAKWDGASWSALGAGVDDTVLTLAVHDDGTGAALYAGGMFTSAGGVPVNYIAKWDGTTWSALEGGTDFWVRTLAVHDDGGGAELYAGGDFTFAGATPASHVAKWDGVHWSPLGSGMTGTFGSWVRSLVVHDDGSGPALFAGGLFDVAGGAPALGVAKWNGAGWSALGSGVSSVGGLAVYDDGGGAALYAGGGFGSAGGVAASHVAKWNGSVWSPLGSGVNHEVLALGVFDDGSGPALYAGGFFSAAGGTPANRIAAWNGSAWSALDSGWNGTPMSMLSFDDGSGPALWVGGSGVAASTADANLGKWGCTAISVVPGCFGNPAALAALAPAAPLGAVLPLEVRGEAAQDGLCVAYGGASGVGIGGCGIFVPGLGELLLAFAPPPVLVASGLLTAGDCGLAAAVPAQPALSGITVYLQGAALDPGLAQPIEVANALSVLLGP